MNVVLRLREASAEFLWVGWGLQSHFRVQPNNCVEVVLRCVVVGVVTIRKLNSYKCPICYPNSQCKPVARRNIPGKISTFSPVWEAVVWVHREHGTHADKHHMQGLWSLLIPICTSPGFHIFHMNHCQAWSQPQLNLITWNLRQPKKWKPSTDAF